jgi:pyrimidine-specific ribonucleoside hydrolase
LSPGAGPLRVVVDTDPGVDDAAAILLALASPELDVVGLTTVAGNAPLSRTTDNALKVLELAGRGDVPVAAGADRSLLGNRAPEEPAEHDSVHAADGLGGALPAAPAGRPVPRHAVDLIAEAAAVGPLTVVAIAPLTNLALALALRPELAGRIDRLVVMGGARLEGNITAAAEFNVWADPEAAARVFRSGIALTLLPLDITHEALLSAHDLDRLAAGGKVGERLAAMIRAYGALHRPYYGTEFAPLHDVLAVLALTDPDAIEFEEAVVEVDTGWSASRGATLVSSRPGMPGAPALVGRRLDRDRFAEVLVGRVGALDARLDAAGGSAGAR